MGTNNGYDPSLSWVSNPWDAIHQNPSKIRRPLLAGAYGCGSKRLINLSLITSLSSAFYRLADLMSTGQLTSICRSAYLVDVDLLLDPRYSLPNHPELQPDSDFGRVLEPLRKSIQKRYPKSNQNGLQKGPQKRSKITKMWSWRPPKIRTLKRIQK